MSLHLNMALGTVLLASVVVVSFVSVGLGFEVDVADSVRRLPYACKVSRREWDEIFLGCS